MRSSEIDHDPSAAFAAGDSVNSENLCFDNIDGADIELKVITHQPSLCHEFVVKSPKFNIKRWFISTVILYAAACVLQLHVQDIRLLVAMVFAISLAVVVRMYFKVSKESMLVVSAVGIQLTTTFFSGRQITKFYDMSDINAVIINEAITMHRVIFYLAILLGPASSPLEQRLVPLFTNSWPRLKCLTHIYQEVSDLLPLNSKEEEDKR